MNRLNPVPIVFSFLMISGLLIFCQNPIFIACVFIYVLLINICVSGKADLKRIFIQGLYFVTIAVFINLIISSNGKTILFRTSHLPILGRIDISVEEIVFSIVSVVKIIGILILMDSYSKLIDFDQLFYLLSKFFNKLSLTISIIYNMIFKMRTDMDRIHGVLKTRGVDFEEKNLIKRVRNYYFLIKILIISSLEGSIDYAQSLYSRDYNSNHRTCYIEFEFIYKDRIMIVFDMILFMFVIYCTKLQIFGFQYYPRLDVFEILDIYIAGFFSSILFLKLIVIKSYFGGVRNGCI